MWGALCRADWLWCTGERTSQAGQRCVLALHLLRSCCRTLAAHASAGLAPLACLEGAEGAGGAQGDGAGVGAGGHAHAGGLALLLQRAASGQGARAQPMEAQAQDIGGCALKEATPLPPQKDNSGCRQASAGWLSGQNAAPAHRGDNANLALLAPHRGADRDAGALLVAGLQSAPQGEGEGRG